jgi:hypothetical protein
MQRALDEDIKIPRRIKFVAEPYDLILKSLKAFAGNDGLERRERRT